MKPGKSAASATVFPRRSHKAAGHQHRRRRCRLTANQLDERHQRHGIHEMHPDDAVGAGGRRAQRRDRNRGGVRGHNRVHLRDDVELREQRTFRLDVFDNRLHEEVSICQELQRRRHRQAAQRLVALDGPERALLDKFAQALGDRHSGAIEHRHLEVDQVDGESGLGEDLGDAMAHRARADHTNRSNVHGSISHEVSQFAGSSSDERRELRKHNRIQSRLSPN